MLIVLTFLILVIVVLLVLATHVYNGIVRADNRCDSAWQTISAQLARKGELAADLVASVRDHPEQECSPALAEVAHACEALKDAATPEETAAASVALEGGLRHLTAASASEAEVAGDERYLQLTGDLTDIDATIRAAGATYNECVLAYNNAITTFPGNLIAGTRFLRRSDFEVPDGAPTLHTEA